MTCGYGPVGRHDGGFRRRREKNINGFTCVFGECGDNEGFSQKRSAGHHLHLFEEDAKGIREMTAVLPLTEEASLVNRRLHTSHVESAAYWFTGLRSRLIQNFTTYRN